MLKDAIKLRDALLSLSVISLKEAVISVRLNASCRKDGRPERTLIVRCLLVKVKFTARGTQLALLARNLDGSGELLSLGGGTTVLASNRRRH